MVTSQQQKIIKICLIVLFGGAFVYYYYTYNPSVNTNQFLACPSKSILGFNCPGCGSQRVIHHLLNFNFRNAFRYNPLLVIMFPFVLYLIYVQLYNFVNGANKRVAILYDNRFVIAFFIVIVLYAVLRNLPYWPLTLLAPPN